MPSRSNSSSTPTRLALTNATGRQAASLARSASAIGWDITAHLNATKYNPLVAKELEELPNVHVLIGRLSSPDLRQELFRNADIAFVNTTTFDDELEEGKACIDAARAAGVKHLVYSSMPDHAKVKGKNWQSLPHWAPKWHVEEYARTLTDFPVTFVHTGIYYNNFTSLPYPLFCLKEVAWDDVLQWEGDRAKDWVPEQDGEKTKGRKCGFEWRAPFPRDLRLPVMDCEHDFGPCVLQIFKGGPKKWAGKRIPVAFAYLDPPAICAAFSRGLNRPVRYVEAPVEISVPVPKGYRGQLEALQGLLGGNEVDGKRAPYWWETMFDTERLLQDTSDVESTDGDDDEPIIQEDEEEYDEHYKNWLRVTRKLWGGWRDVEGYARDVFPVEEKLNGMTWMKDNKRNGDEAGDDE